MLKKFVSSLVDNVAKEPFDPATLEDPVALKTAWAPLQRGGSFFRTHELVQISISRVEFRATPFAQFLRLIFVVMGCVSLYYFFAQFFQENSSEFVPASLILPLGAAIFIGIGVYKWSKLTLPIVFDMNEGYFWKGKQAPNTVADQSSLLAGCTLDDIYALQIIEEHFKRNQNAYYCYELNIVLADGQRINVVDHGSKKGVIHDANTLGEFLSKPVWNALKGKAAEDSL